MTDETRSQEDFDYFSGRIDVWRGLLGLADWEFNVGFRELEVGVSAECEVHSECRTANITLNTLSTNYDGEDNKFQLCRTAFHECCHVVLSDLVYVSLHAPGSMIDMIDEACVRRMENAFHNQLLRLNDFALGEIPKSKEKKDVKRRKRQ